MDAELAFVKCRDSAAVGYTKQDSRSLTPAIMAQQQKVIQPHGTSGPVTLVLLHGLLRSPAVLSGLGRWEECSAQPSDISSCSTVDA